MTTRFDLKALKAFFWPTFFLSLALLLAVSSSFARQNGQYYAAAFMALLALIFAFIVSVTLVPRLLSRISLDFLMNLRFFRFTKRGAFFVVIVFIISFATFNTGNNLLILILAFLLASMIVSGIVANLVLFGLKISLNVPRRIHAGQRAVFLLTLHNLKRFFPSFALKLKGESPPGEESGTDFFVQEKQFPYVSPGERLCSRLPCQFERRGEFPIEGFEVNTTFPFGFFWRGRELEASGRILVYPELHDLGSLPFLHPYLQGVEQRNQKGTGGELYNIRQFQAGDNARHVHWRSTAKLTQLMVKDFAMEEELPLHVMFSTYLPELSESNLRKFEKAVSYVASLGDYCRKKGQKFTLTASDVSISVTRDSQEYDQLMEYLALVRPDEQDQLPSEKMSTPCILFAAGAYGQWNAGPVVNYLEL